MTEATIKEDGTEITIKVNDMPLDRLLPIIEQALKGCGYVFDGELDIIKENL